MGESRPPASDSRLRFEELAAEEVPCAGGDDVDAKTGEGGNLREEIDEESGTRVLSLSVVGRVVVPSGRGGD